ncbi:hypothetical protein [Paenarthrobacter histidinolovorans]|uniref:Uncharacterized protein n=1 Tax=Paenarthrobacter histidinolovorans TaxID=43664 RepID=A0ABW8N4E2_9MICC
MHRLKRYDGFVPEESWEAATKAHNRLAEHHPKDATALLMSMRMLISAALTAEAAAEMVRKSFAEWFLDSAPDASCYLIEVSETLGYRYSVTRALLNTHDPVQAEHGRAARELLFESARGLFSDTTFGLSAYLDCMCTSLSPEVWAFPIGRPGAVILILFGAPMSGQSSLPLDKIQLFSPAGHGVTESRTDPELQSPVMAKAALWWIQQLNTLFSIATEPANHVRNGVYDPSMALEKLLTLEQVFRDCQSIATATRDRHAQLSLAFQALVRMQGLVPGLNWKKVAGLSEVKSTMALIKETVPAALHPVFLPRAEQAIEALEELERGFFLANLAGENEVRLPGPNGKEELVHRRQAVTEWLLLYRNSLHGFDKVPTPRQRALLAAHDGKIPGAIADLAWLQLLALLARPESLSRFQRKRERTS